MKLTRIHLYTLNYREPAALPEDVILWAATPEEAVARFATDHPVTGSDLAVHITGPEVDATYRVDPETEPAGNFIVEGGWAASPPPLNRRNYLARLRNETDFKFVVVTKSNRPDLGDYESEGNYHFASDISHHNPIPVE
jgi:hypothetical protein